MVKTPVFEVRFWWHVRILQHDLRLVNRQDKRGVPGDLWPLRGFSQRQQERRRRRGAEGRRGKRENCCCCLLLTFPGVRLPPPSSLVTLCCLYSPARLALSAKLIFVCRPWLQRARPEMWKTSLESTLSACTGKQKNKKKLYRQFNWSVRCSEIRADTNTWFHLKDKAQRHLVLIIVINPVTQSWKSSSVCLYKYDYCKCNLKHCARIWMRPWFWYDRGRSWLRTGHDPGQDRRLSPEPLKVTKS